MFIRLRAHRAMYADEYNYYNRREPTIIVQNTQNSSKKTEESHTHVPQHRVGTQIRQKKNVHVQT